MTPMTSSAASDTERARKRTGESAEPVNEALRRRTSTPPPPGRWTSSSTTSGRVAVMTETACSTSPASPTTSTPVSSVRPISAWTPARNIRWSSTRTTLTWWDGDAGWDGDADWDGDVDWDVDWD